MYDVVDKVSALGMMTSIAASLAAISFALRSTATEGKPASIGFPNDPFAQTHKYIDAHSQMLAMANKLAEPIHDPVTAVDYAMNAFNDSQGLLPLDTRKLPTRSKKDNKPKDIR